MLTRRSFGGCALCAAIGLAATGLAATGAAAQAPGLKRTILKRMEFPGDRYVTLLVKVEIDPNALVARHTHPGVETAYILSGGGLFSVAGQPDREVKAGDAMQIAPETPHSVRNGPAPTEVLVTYVVEKDKPLASPA